jgi:hypothetical protein
LVVEKKILKTPLAKRMFPYSPKNRKAKLNPLYSILNPETNSLSPSAKSKGARFVSHKKRKKNTPPIKRQKIAFFLPSTKREKSNDLTQKRGKKTNVIRQIS